MITRTRFFEIIALAAAMTWLVRAGGKNGSVLPDPPEVRGGNHVVALTLRAATNAEGRDAFSFNGKAAAPVIRAWPGDTLRIEYINELPKVASEPCAIEPCHNMTNLHFHGLEVSPHRPQDDVLEMMAMPGETLHYAVQIPPNHPPGLYWYHTHPHGESHRQALDGMSGALVIEGIESYFPALAGLPERVLVVRGRSIEHDPQSTDLKRRVELSSATCGAEPETPEEVFTVNGSVRPQIEIAPGERQFWRIVNASADPDGDPNPAMILADIVPRSATDSTTKVSKTSLKPDLKTLDLAAEEKAPPRFIVTFTEDKKGFYINGEKFTPDAAPMVRAKVGTFQHWRIVNDSKELHPMHIHQAHFLAYAENDKPIADPLWLDTVNVPYGGSVDVIMDFTNPVIRGMSVFHCHLLNHEDKGMMAKILFQ